MSLLRMGNVLFLPLNTNHVLIFSSIIGSLRCAYTVLCHDRLTVRPQYHTEPLLKQLHIRYQHVLRPVNQSFHDHLIKRFVDFLRMRRVVRETLRQIQPSVLVVALDNDPVSRLFLDEARAFGSKTMLIQEALLRPGEVDDGGWSLSHCGYSLLSRFGVHLIYSGYGTGSCDQVLVSGSIGADILGRGRVPADRIVIVGQPKYDAVISRLNGQKAKIPQTGEKKTYLFAAATTIVHDERNVDFLRNLIASARRLGFHLVIKLHPRTPQDIGDIASVIGVDDPSAFSIVKGGDDTFELLQKAYGFITVSSTVVLEALMMDKECIIARYLAGNARLEYDEYDAVHIIDHEQSVHAVLEKSLTAKKDPLNKERLLESELFKLDGRAGERAARAIETLARHF